MNLTLYLMRNSEQIVFAFQVNPLKSSYNIHVQQNFLETFFSSIHAGL